MTPEGKVKKKIDTILKNYGIWFFKPRGTILGRSGIPDYICLYNGIMIAIEAKAGKNKPTALQVKELNDLKRNGAITLVINESNLEELEDTIHVITLNNTNIYS